MNDATWKKTMRSVLDACADCDTCRFLMDESCLLFPELYRLHDAEKESGRPVSEVQLRRLSELCTLCGLCPCPDIRTDVIRAKTQRVRREGAPLAVRLLADVQRFGRGCSRVAGIVNTALQVAPIARAAKKIAGIHPRRQLPPIAEETFFSWAHRAGLARPTERHPKVAYFAGCSAGYFFPQVARAAVAVLAQNGVSVYVPPQQCCGMPTLLEGDERTTARRVRANLYTLLRTVEAGYDLVCSCPTCGFLIKVLLKERAYYSDAYQRSVHAADDDIKIPDHNAGGDGFMHLKKSMYNKILTNDGYFSAMDPLQRIALADGTMDMGTYLERRYREGKLNTRLGKIEARMVTFAPCHQREQGIGSPYETLLRLIPGLVVEPVGGAMDCCGMGGSLGYKESFYEQSITLGRPLLRKIEAAAPEAIITECISCRLQFQHLLPYPVYHPLEMFSRSYASAD